MKRLSVSCCVAMIVGISMLPVATLAQVQAYPSRLIKLVVAYGPGGGTDLLARLLAQSISPGLGQPVVVENRPGASGNIGSEMVAKSAPDGYTLLMATNSLAINPFLYKSIGIDVAKDLTGVAKVATAPILLVTHPSLPARTVGELIAYAKQHPRKLNFGSPGVGTPQHLATELFMSMTGAQMVHVPYKGGAQAASDLIAGQVDLMFAAIISTLPHVKAGKLRAIAIGDKQRAQSVKDLPTIDEAGVRGYEVGIWYAILAPANTSVGIIAAINRELAKALANPAIVERMREQGFESAFSTPEDMNATIRSDLNKWRSVVKSAGIAPE
ncbi:MAG: tripartite tricarboxylate transporter substrate binding protein [Betaproteobacteria bacterium]|nr:tripartite tricarboxylate transporter substrate binding protein [Betaproteobacteria bacterium]MBI2960103.1 tripartite tricarboxylate transporter substrate binding protein [Betaproteobacteria bacterium]